MQALTLPLSQAISQDTVTQGTPSQPTLQDVADRCGVSTATVSRCLNAPDRVGKDTRDRVLAAIDALGYAPNFGARLMAAGRSNTIGAVIPTMENAIFAQGLQAFQDGLHQAGFTLLVASSGYDPQVEADQVRTLASRGADGLLLIGQGRDKAVYDLLHARGLPALLAWTYRADAPHPAIGFDNVAAMAELADAVLDQGHRRIGYISADTTTNDRAAERLAGVRAAMARRGLSDGDLELCTVPYGIETGAQAFRTLMTQTNRPTAVMCGNDVLAAGAMGAARDLGLAVPKDVSITGFDDIELAQVTSPGLTTVHVPHAQMGAKAADALVARVAQDAPLISVKLPTRLVMRGTLGPAP